MDFCGKGWELVLSKAPGAVIALMPFVVPSKLVRAIRQTLGGAAMSFPICRQTQKNVCFSKILPVFKKRAIFDNLFRQPKE
jgi:hypothetical protein